MHFSNDTDSPMQAPLGVGDHEASQAETFEQDFSEVDGAHDPLAGASSGRKIRSGALVLGTVVVIAVGGLFAMRSLSLATAGSFGASEVEQTVDEFVRQLDNGEGPSVLVRGRDEALHMLHHDFTDRQVPLQDTQRNPFIVHHKDGADTVTPGPDEPGVDPEEIARQELERRRAERRSEIESVANSLRLQAVLLGSNPMANVSGQYARVGETLEFDDSEVVFTLNSMTNETLELVAVDEELDLELTFTLQLREVEQ